MLSRLGKSIRSGGSGWFVLHEKGQSILARWSRSTGSFYHCPVTSDYLWADCTVEATVPQIPGVAIGRSPDLASESTLNNGRHHQIYESLPMARFRHVRH
ncbi:MAG: hypothetical protein J7J76_07380 [Candidatus Latescibacteria bacterium]|nr:hypothetical protein [Candidatus Latescibacterota bacterium]